MILKIITGIAVLYVILKGYYVILKDTTDDGNSSVTATVDYDIIDEIVREREQVRCVEDMISSAESYHAGEHEKAVQISWFDPSGRRTVNTFVNDDFLKYAYSERERLRSSLAENLTRVNRFKTDLKLRKSDCEEQEERGEDDE